MDGPAVETLHLYHAASYGRLISIQFIFAVGSLLSSNTEMILLMYNPAVYSTADVIGTYLYRDGPDGRKVQLRNRSRPVCLSHQFHSAVLLQQGKHQAHGLGPLVTGGFNKRRLIT